MLDDYNKCTVFIVTEDVAAHERVWGSLFGQVSESLKNRESDGAGMSRLVGEAEQVIKVSSYDAQFAICAVMPTLYALAEGCSYVSAAMKMCFSLKGYEQTCGRLKAGVEILSNQGDRTSHCVIGPNLFYEQQNAGFMKDHVRTVDTEILSASAYVPKAVCSYPEYRKYDGTVWPEASERNRDIVKTYIKAMGEDFEITARNVLDALQIAARVGGIVGVSEIELEPCIESATDSGSKSELVLRYAAAGVGDGAVPAWAGWIDVCDEIKKELASEN